MAAARSKVAKVGRKTCTTWFGQDASTRGGNRPVEEQKSQLAEAPGYCFCWRVSFTRRALFLFYHDPLLEHGRGWCFRQIRAEECMTDQLFGSADR